MAEEIIMPKLGTTMEEGEIVKWYKEEGDTIEPEEVIMDVLTDKATLEVEATAGGVLLKKLYQEGDVVPVTEVVAVVGEAGEDISDLVNSLESETEESTEEVSQTEVSADKEVKTASDSTSMVEVEGKVKASPAARRVASEEDIDLSDIQGSGPEGRVIEADAKQFASQSQYRATPTAKKIAESEGVELDKLAEGRKERIYKQDVLEYTQAKPSQEEEKRQPMSGLQKAGARHLRSSWEEIPHVTVTSEVDMSASLAWLDKINDKLEDNLSPTDLILKALAKAIKDQPKLNAHLEEEEIVYSEAINLGLAVDVEGQLVVPVLENVDRKGLKEINQTKSTLAKKARANKLSQAEMQGSNLTVTNLGMFGVDIFTPIINTPASGILGVGQIKEKPIAIEGEVEVRSMMWLSLAFDHRLINGAPAAKFLQRVTEILEQPELLVV